MFSVFRNFCINKKIKEYVVDPSATSIDVATQEPMDVEMGMGMGVGGGAEAPLQPIVTAASLSIRAKTRERSISSLEARPSVENIPIMDLVGKETKRDVRDTIFEPRSVPPPHEEQQYLGLIRDILDHGYMEPGGRNGNTIVKFGHSMRFSLHDGKIPILTTKRVAWRACFEELFWFIRGSTSNTELIAKNVHIWDANGCREFLDGRGLYGYEENDLGPIYGFQWRHFNAPYKTHRDNYQGEGVDQLAEIIRNLKNPATRSSRRLIMTAWNPCQLDYMALPPCHVLAQFHVREGRYLSCALYQRSGDVGLGVPFNIASYSMLTHLLARHCGLEADEFVYFLGNCHIYESHIAPLKTQLTREPKEFPRIRISTQKPNIEDYGLEDVVWERKYECWEAIKMAMVA